ncbi:energy-coupling factor transporter transmembrane component T [Clostridium sp. MD294]|uniref:energy-coupling factor transporter transmembrane component T family protein n=1 Tax=Clostridium sp. MD294 TaxID=97138 RepID=UPI0002CBB2B9|nr:energy-coupling factor transporter transmembrane component T [Clostridium sp. MD294]NDO46046.1 energy-coupling factor transporter transmembrane protein EcfT [Clostridium sp. MD294]USF30290.1 Energy-coupling factor transporter transmembrane protein EcfT [Clostridium sp. MD294]
MIRDITIGQYYPVNSPIHSMDARVKLIITFLFILTLFFVNTFLGYIFVILCMSAVIKASKVPLKFMLKGIKGILIIILFTAFINVFMTRGEHILFEWGIFTVTTEGILIAIKMCIRIVLLVIGSSILTLTTTPIQLTDGIEYILRPFKKIGVPAHEIAMMMTIALRFIPTLLDETDKIMKAQQARGADFDSGSLLQRAKSLIPILVPLFISSFRRADELAMAMEARCYHGDENRTRMNVMILKSSDYRAVIILVAYCIALIVLRFAASQFSFIW